MERLHLLKLLLVDVRSGFDSDRFIRQLQDVLPHDLNVSRVGVYLYDEDANGLVSNWLIGDRRPRKIPSSVVQPAGYSISGVCFAENRVVHIPDCSQTDLIPAKYVQSLRLGASVALPIPGPEGTPIGVLRIDREQPVAFDEDDLDFLETLSAVLGTIISNTRVYHELKEAERQLAHSASHDPLTGLPNRRLFAEHLEKAVQRQRRSPDRCFAVLYMDLDGFKKVNDRLGHAAGDELLHMTAVRARTALREIDVIARLGGDEFAILLDDLKDAGDAKDIAQRLLAAVSHPMVIAGESVLLTVSIGIAISNHRYESRDSIIRNADEAMYRAKAAGKSCYMVFDDSRESA